MKKGMIPPQMIAALVVVAGVIGVGSAVTMLWPENLVDCYQEHAKSESFVDGSCNLTYSGNYEFDRGIWMNMAGLSDSDWDSYGNQGSQDKWVYFYAEYSKPDMEIVRVKWETKVQSDDLRRNHTILKECLVEPTLKLRIGTNHQGNKWSVVYECFDGSEYIEIASDNTEGSSGGNIFEEGVHWIHKPMPPEGLQRIA